MLSRLPYRMQIPLGLSLAVVLAALLVTAVAAQIFARTARADTLATVDRAAQLLSAQSLPLLVADDTWRVFALLRSTSMALFLYSASLGLGLPGVLRREGGPGSIQGFSGSVRVRLKGVVASPWTPTNV